MNEPASRYRQAKAIFLLVQQRPIDVRGDFLAEACGGDAALRDEVEALLAEEQTGGAMLDHLDRLHAQPTLPPDYRIVRELGRGGMGVVWLAERDAGDFRQRVAFKLLGVDALRDPDRRARFRAERRILASLEHPHIARLIDGGTLADGTPFLAMEFVDGERLDAWAERARPSLRHLLKLFVAICRAVQAAHQRLIVHRDLKPANILVDGYGAPKLLDFGIAKLLDDSVEVEVATGTGMQLLTPRYAAPEQVRGETITTATDVYALGVILYELLTGSSPYGRAAATPDQLRAICDTEPVRPSLATRGDGATGTTSAAHLRGDLDAILLKCLRKEPGKRYRGAAELADDLECFLDARPVAARAGSTRYALGKFISRHRYLVASMVLVLVVIAAAGILLLSQLQETARQRDLAERQRDRAEQSFELLSQVLASADPANSQGQELTARQILDAGAARLMQQTQVDGTLRAELLVQVAITESTLGLRDSATAHLDAAAALAGGDVRIDERIALQRLLLMSAAGEMNLADAASQRMLESIERGTSTLDASGRADVLILRGNVLNFLGRGEDSVAMLRRALAELPDTPALARKRLSAHSQLGQNLQNLGRLGEAEQELRLALAISRDQHLDPLRISRDQNNLAGVLAMQGRFAEAMELHRSGIARFVEVVGESHPEYAVRLNNLGMTEFGAGDVDAAHEHLQQAFAIAQQRHGPDSHIAASVRSNLAGVRAAVGNFAQAQADIDAALAALLAKVGPNSLLTVRAMRVAGTVAVERGDADSARRHFDDCERAGHAAGLDANPTVVRCGLGRAELELDAGHAEAARTALERAAPVHAKLDAKHMDRGFAALLQARVALHEGDVAAAARVLADIPDAALNEPWQRDWRDLLAAFAAGQCAQAEAARARLSTRYPSAHARLQFVCPARSADRPGM